MIIGITGGVGSGKSTAIEYMAENWTVRILKTDDMAKELMDKDELLSRLETAFGRSLRSASGGLDRELYRDILYSSAENTELSDSIVHPAVWDLAKKEAELAEKEGLLALIETALPSKSFRELCDLIIVFSRDEGKRRDTLYKERGYDSELFQDINERQLSDEGYLAYADILIENNGSLDELKERIKKELNAVYKSCKREQR